MQKKTDQTLASGQKDPGHRPHQKGTDECSHTHSTAHEKACGHKTDIHQDADRSEGF